MIINRLTIPLIVYRSLGNVSNTSLCPHATRPIFRCSFVLCLITIVTIPKCFPTLRIISFYLHVRITKIDLNNITFLIFDVYREFLRAFRCPKRFVQSFVLFICLRKHAESIVIFSNNNRCLTDTFVKLRHAYCDSLFSFFKLAFL